jgi:hypothetical protein
MSSIDYAAETDLLYSSGAINAFASNKLMELAKQEPSEKRWQSAVDYWISASEEDVLTEKGADKHFFITTYSEPILRDAISVFSKSELADFKSFASRNSDNFELSDPESIRLMVRDWVHPLSKQAHPNVGRGPKREVEFDVSKWTSLVKQASYMVATGLHKHDALNRVAQALVGHEKLAFLYWATNEIRGEFKKYHINDSIRQKNLSLAEDKRMHKIASDDQWYYIPNLDTGRVPDETAPTQKRSSFADDERYAIDFESARNKLMSRIFAIDKLLEKYRKTLNEEQVDGITDSLNELRKKVRKLRLAASVKDTLIKTANQLNRLNFDDGAQELFALADDEALKGTGLVNRISEPVPAKEREVAINTALDHLNNISAVLKNRDLIRSLAEVDLMLHRLRMSSFFPEIQEAQSKLIDAFGYASNKLEDLIPKLRGGLAEQPEIVPPPPGIGIDDEVKELSKDIDLEPKKHERKVVEDEPEPVVPKRQPAPATKPPPPKAPESIVEDNVLEESFEDEPVNIRQVPGLD